MMAKDFGRPRDAVENVKSQFVAKFVEEAKHHNVSSQLLKHIEGARNSPVTLEEMSLHQLLYGFAEMGGSDCELFVDFCKQRMTDVILKEVESATRTQCKSEFWYEMRFGYPPRHTP
ncbi:unnamed protein product [Ceutorhynchus assimilis]|uniref:Uncharacterized protein n=1 Tax=Ceutorhynchus assimilis TaxID=467358 RepID=A0A9N9MRD6_9CUCU|nr:unnamed protein product [Ceutorhynchus assimilis]